MKILGICLSVGLLAGCASTTQLSAQPVDQELEDTPLTALPAQNLEQAECGLFVWTRQLPHRFILFDRQGGDALILTQGAASSVSMASTPIFHNGSEGETINRTYTGSNSRLTFNLSGTLGPAGPAGWPLIDGLLKTQLEDGTQAIMPVIGIFSCNSGMPEPAPGTP